MYVYKIYNDINSKVYIGITSNIKNRWRSHLKCSKNYPLYRDMEIYGKDMFHIEIIENVEDIEDARNKEAKYIKLYKSMCYENGYNILSSGKVNSCDNNPRKKLTVEDVLYIRNVYSQKKITPKIFWENEFSEKISWSAFQKIWQGKTWKDIGMEVYTDDLKNYYSLQTKNLGNNNGNSLLSENEVLESRIYYVNHTMKDTYNTFGKYFKSIDSFRMCINYSYPNIPVYHKKTNIWTLNGKIIFIEDYLNPVSTISESGE